MNAPVSEGSAVLIDAPRSQPHKKNLMVGRAVLTMSGDRWVPVKIINSSDKQVTLRRNAKVADVFPCVDFGELGCECGPYLSEDSPGAQSECA